MDDEAGFLSAIRQSPADDTARLAYADWLDERDDPASRAKSDFIRLELRMAAAPERGLNRVRWVNKLQSLAATLDADWLRTVSHPALEACRVSFEFQCPKRWDRLTPTADENLRFCESCKKNVHYCATLQDARDHARRGDCVAVSLALVRRPDDLTPLLVSQGAVAGGLSFRLTPDMIERLGVPGGGRAAEVEDTSDEPRPPRASRRRRDRGQNRDIPREDDEGRE